MSKLDVARLKEPAAWIMLAAGVTSTLVAVGRFLIGGDGAYGSSIGLTERGAIYFSSLTSPVTIALLVGAVLLLTKVGPTAKSAGPVTMTAAITLSAMALFGVLALFVALFAGNGFRSIVELLLTGLPTLALTVLAALYLMPQALPARRPVTTFSPQPGFGQPQGYGQQSFAQQPGFTPQPGFGQPEYAQSEYGQQPEYAQQPTSGQAFAQPAPGQAFGQQPPSGQQPAYAQPGYGQGQPGTGQQGFGQPGFVAADPGQQPGHAQPDPGQQYGQPPFAQSEPGQSFGQQGFGAEQEAYQGFQRPAAPEPPAPQPRAALPAAPEPQQYAQPEPQQFNQDPQPYNQDPQPYSQDPQPYSQEPQQYGQEPQYAQPAQSGAYTTPGYSSQDTPNVYAPEPPPAQNGYNTVDTAPPPGSGYAPADTVPPSGGYTPSETMPDSGYTPAPYVPADSQPDVYHQQPQSGAYTAPDPNPYAPPQNPGAHDAYATPSSFAPPEPTPYAPAADAPNPYAPPQDGQAGTPYYERPPAFEQQGQPFTGSPGQEYAQPQHYQEPDPPVDPRSQQLLDAYQQAEHYQHSTAGTAPDLRVPDYTGQAGPYDDPFGHPQQQPPAPQQPQQAYQPGWNGGESPAESTVRLDQSMFRGGDALNDPPRQGDDPIDPTAIYTPNEPRR
ncbi:hypothetical protein ACIBHY_38255 [Nonomuraea sp. NPDC050547]|uniref:hypothetical protein n=1 Tax=Nonomuraea sp. NPDC050547 TaxID=3364368 RepID=UPI0037B2C1EA